MGVLLPGGPCRIGRSGPAVVTQLYGVGAAVEEGIVSSGGTALLYASRSLQYLAGANDDQTLGIDIVRKAAALQDAASGAGMLITPRRLSPK